MLSRRAMWSVVLLAVPGWAQQESTPVYMTINYYKVQPGKNAEFRALMKDFALKYYTAATAKSGGPLAWSLSQFVMPGGALREADFATVTLTQGAPQAANDELAKATTGMTFAQYLEKARLVHTMVRSELLVAVHRRGSRTVGDYTSVNYIKIAPNRGGDFTKVHAEWDKVLGEYAAQGHMKAWASWRRVFPRGTREPYDHITADTYKSYDDALQGFGRGARVRDVYAKAVPGGDFAAFQRLTGESRQIVRSHLVRIVEMVERK